jgi:hypothetical protein
MTSVGRLAAAAFGVCMALSAIGTAVAQTPTV